MNNNFFYEENDLNWSSQQLKIAHLFSESRIKEKQIELSNFLLNNDSYLLSREKAASKQLRRISEQTSKLRFEVLYLEKDLNDIESNKKNTILSTKTDSSKTINSIQMDMIKDNQKIEKLKQDIKEQRKKYIELINEEKKEKEEIIKDYDQVIFDLWQEIKQTEIRLFSSSSKSFCQSSMESTLATQSTLDQQQGLFYDHKDLLEMKSTGSFLDSELDDVYESIQKIQTKIEKEIANKEQLLLRLKEIETISAKYKKELSDINDQHRKFRDELESMETTRINNIQ